jgi:hypothetical protein
LRLDRGDAAEAAVRGGAVAPRRRPRRLLRRPRKYRRNTDGAGDSEQLTDKEAKKVEKIIKKRACIRMSVGTALVILFSDPMVDVLSAWRNVLGISPSYISVVLAPLALVHCKGLAWQFKAETISIMVIQWIIGALAYFCSTHATTIGIGIYRFDPDEMAEPFLPNCTIDLNKDDDRGRPHQGQG